MTKTSLETIILGGAPNMFANETLKEFFYQEMAEINIPGYIEKEITFAIMFT